VALLLQAGFLQDRLESLGDSVTAAHVAREAKELLALQPESSPEEQERDVQRQLAQSLQSAWRRLLKST